MPDNVNIPTGVGATVATDEVSDATLGTAQVQFIKVMDGTLNGTNKMAVNLDGSVNVTSASGFITIGSVPSGTTDSGNPVKIGLKYNASTPIVADGQRVDAQATVNGFLKTELSSLLGGEDLTNNVLGVISKPIAAITYSLSTDNPAIPVTKKNSKTGIGNVYGFVVSNFNSTVRYFQLHNKASTPAGGDTASLSLPIPALSGSTIGNFVVTKEVLGEGGHYLSAGVSWAVSTTHGTFTDSATASDHIVLVKYI